MQLYLIQIEFETLYLGTCVLVVVIFLKILLKDLQDVNSFSIKRYSLLIILGIKSVVLKKVINIISDMNDSFFESNPIA